MNLHSEDFAHSEALVLSYFGFKTIGIVPRTRTSAASEMEISALAQTILNFLPDIVISDKGLGLIDGIELIKQVRLKSDQVITVMLTGEISTRETHRKAHLYFEKGIHPEVLVDKINNYRFEEE